MPEKRNFARQEYVPEGQWVYGEPHTIDCPTPHIHTADVGKQPIDEDTIGQFTGVTGGDGREIYEDDIVAIYHEKHCTFKGKVEFLCGEFVVNSKDKLITALRRKPWQVIGNIHDNPELLKGGEKCQ